MMTEILRLRSTKAILVAAMALAPVACGDDATGPGSTASPDSGSAAVTLSAGVPATAPSAAIAPAFPFDIVFSDGASTLTLTRVAIVLRDIELEEQFDECDDISGSDDDGCEEFESGPFILELPLDGTVGNAITVTNVPAGTYDELEFKVHKPEDDTPAGLDFLSRNPDFRDVSIRVEGDFDGLAFVYETDLNEEQEIPLSPPLVVTDGASLNLTFSVDVATWFRTAGGSLIDPASANKGQPNEQLVEDNIEASIDIFEDNDRDGHDDSSDD